MIAALLLQAMMPTTSWTLCAIPLETILLPVLFQLVLIVLAARVFFVMFRRFKQPGVVGEIAAGLVLGPSVLGYFFPAQHPRQFFIRRRPASIRDCSMSC